MEGRFTLIDLGENGGEVKLPSVNEQTYNYCLSVIQYLVDNGMFNESYKTPLYMLAASIQQFYDAQEAIQKHGLITNNSRGDLMANPAVALQNAARRESLQIMDRFGLSPIAKSKLKLINKEVASPLEGFLTESVEIR